MERIFAPWRIDWVSRDNSNADFDGCVFCVLAKADEDRAHRVVARNGRAFAVLNKDPYNPGHVLVIPDMHGGDFTDLSMDTLTSVASLQQQTVAAVDRALGPNGFNVGMNLGKAGGASITDHVHVHVVPRWNGDTTFMPTTANAKIIAEALDETYDRLHAAFQELKNATFDGSDIAVHLNETGFSEEST